MDKGRRSNQSVDCRNRTSSTFSSCGDFTPELRNFQIDTEESIGVFAFDPINETPYIVLPGSG
ncbi:MAG: hypothetical protein R2845_16565, partial [Thermomicrobiales bacterium]